VPPFLYAGRLEPAVFVVWVLFVAGAVAVVVVSVRRALAAGRRVPFSPAGMLVPVAAVLLTIAAFTVGRGHPLAQYNGGHFAWFGVWVYAWPVLLLGGLLSVLGTAAGFVANAGERGHPGGWIAALTANLATLPCVAANFPSA
jgi:hypothetical protein